jgi:Uma2 family endonuclease
MATAPPILTIEQYLHTSYKPDVHFVDGEIEERNGGEYSHAKIQAFIATLFTNQEDEWHTDAVVEQRMRVDSSRVRVCDVAILRSETPLEEVTATPPLICIEILSPEDRISRAELVLADYFAMGVPNIWLIDPGNRAAYTFGPTGLQPANPSNLTVPNTAIRIDLSSLFAKLDRKAAESRTSG